jgi:hypothetical protein
MLTNKKTGKTTKKKKQDRNKILEVQKMKTRNKTRNIKEFF